MRWQVGKAGGVLVRDARVTGGEEGEKADGEAGEARGRAAGMGRDGRGGTGWAGFEMATRLSKHVFGEFCPSAIIQSHGWPFGPGEFWASDIFHTHSRRNEVLMNFEGGVQGCRWASDLMLEVGYTIKNKFFNVER